MSPHQPQQEGTNMLEQEHDDERRIIAGENITGDDYPETWDG